LFNSTSNYSDIFNENKIKANINELKKLEVQKKNNKKDKKDKNKKKQKGGGKKDKSKKEKPRTDAGYLATILNNPSKKNNQQQSKKNNKSQKKTNTKTNSSNLKKKIIESLKQVSLYKIYYSEFEDEIIKYFKEYIKVNICNIPGTTDFPISIKVPIFDNKEINLKEFYSKIHKNLTGKQNITRLGCADKTGGDSLFSGFKFDIFQTLIAFDNSDNFKDLFDISKKIKEKVIFLLFTLYSRKKYLYEEYINSCSRIFQIEVKENNKSTNNKKTNNKSSIQKNKEPVMANYENKIKKNKDIQNKKELIILQKFNSKQKNDYIKIKHTLNLLSKRMKELETSGYNDNQNDIKKLKYEKMYHNLIIRQRQLVSSISSF
jgi:hypothetical protein